MSLLIEESLKCGHTVFKVDENVLFIVAKLSLVYKTQVTMSPFGGIRESVLLLIRYSYVTTHKKGEN